MSQEINIKFDGTFDIALGKSRKETNWKNKEITWSSFVRKVLCTHRTAETLSEYMASKKTRQDEIKDIGGFVGGYVNGGRRKAENIPHRQLATLDIDFSKGQTWDDFTMLYGNAATLYSTHKHSSENPRFRLVLPLSRPVSTDEYVAIARRIAGNLDINTFDDTTFEPSRLMYWPSTSKDGEYVFKYQDGPWLNVEEVLATYKNWKDASEWPVSDRAGEVLQHEIKKQGDPLEKPGVVGAFCREYDIHEAIETFLDEAYEACDIEDRYTYKEGSTAAGLVIYDDKYAYSHHGTDPASGKLCNAFDLVRLHLYGLQDEDAKEGTPSNKLPSYTSMVELSAKDPKVRKRLGMERLQDMKGEFSETWEGEEGEEPDSDWLESMDVDKRGNYKNTIDNVRIVLDNDPKVKNRLALNKFEQREVALGDLPWRKIGPKDFYLSDKDDAGIRHYLEKTYVLTGIQKVQDAVALTVERNAFHPVRDYLSSVVWDGELRIGTLFIDYLGAEDSEYIRTVTRKILVAAVARIFRPGCKFDYVLVFVGKQGKGKSTIINKLGGNWYSDSFSTVQGKEAFEQIQGVWLIEMAELAGLKKAELEVTKHFISKKEDRYRVAYGRRIDNFPRQCVFFASTNDREFLRDPTGNRRFWPVDIHEQPPKKSVFDGLEQYEVDQVWAEAVKLYKAGETLYLTAELEQLAFDKQLEHSETDDRSGLVQGYLDTLLPDNWQEMDLPERRRFIEGDELQAPGRIMRQRVCTAEIWCELFGKQKGDMTKYNTKDLHTILRSIDGWEESKFPVNVRGYGRQRVYRRLEVGIQDKKEGNIQSKQKVNTSLN